MFRAISVAAHLVLAIALLLPNTESNDKNDEPFIGTNCTCVLACSILCMRVPNTRRFVQSRYIVHASFTCLVPACNSVFVVLYLYQR